VVCGCRGVGLRTVEQLHNAGVAVVVVADPKDIDPVADRLLSGWDIPRIAGRPREALIEAGIEAASAVVCVPDDDLRSMELALLARRMRPDVRLVVRVGNAAVGRALADVTGSGSVLDVAELAAPSVVEACLGRRAHAIELAGQEFVVAELTVERCATLRDLYGDLAPLAVAGSELVICPGRDHAVRPGERVTAVGTREQFVAYGASDVVTELDRASGLATALARTTAGARGAGAAKAAEREEVGGHAGMWALVRSVLDEADRTMRTTLLVLAALFVVSVLVLRVGYVKEDGSRMTLLDATYFTVETIGTIGYGDFSFAAQAPWLRAYAIGLMLLGVVLATLWFALLTQLILSGRIERSVWRRRIATMRGHVIVVGLGSIGFRVLLSLLAVSERVVVLERDGSNRYLRRARELGVAVVIGDATDPETLAEVNLRRAAAVAVLTSDDLVNIETGLAVRDQLGASWPQVPVVLRVFDHELRDTVETGFGFRHVRSTDALAAPWFVGAALGLTVLGTFYVDHTPFMVGQLTVPLGGGLDGLAMGELSARTRVVAIRRAGEDGTGRHLEHPPRKGTRFGAGDDAFLVGPYEELLAVLRRDALAPGSMPLDPLAPGSAQAAPEPVRDRHPGLFKRPRSRPD
jgi:Trk K+ transport system NAD-binding subunit